jgi:hypothetical protein
MNYVRVLFVSCLLAACAPSKVQQPPTTSMHTPEMELEDARELAAQARARSAVLEERITIMVNQSKRTHARLFECNILTNAYEQALLMGDKEDELGQSQDNQE